MKRDAKKQTNLWLSRLDVEVLTATINFAYSLAIIVLVGAFSSNSFCTSLYLFIYFRKEKLVILFSSLQFFQRNLSEERESDSQRTRCCTVSGLRSVDYQSFSFGGNGMQIYIHTQIYNYEKFLFALVQLATFDMWCKYVLGVLILCSIAWVFHRIFFFFFIYNDNSSWFSGEFLAFLDENLQRELINCFLIWV